MGSAEQSIAQQRGVFIRRLQEYAASIHLELSDQQVALLLDYLELFEKWNKTYNLSAIRDAEGMFTKHLLDSLSIAPHLTGERFIDVGTGGGLPGIPMAICFPNRQFTLLDSAGKKVRFLFQVKQALGLSNVDTQNLRVETFKPQPLFDGVISRAFASINDMLTWCNHLIHDDGRFWAMKGVMPNSELSELPKKYIVKASHALHVPNLEGERCLIELALAQGSNSKA